MLFSHEIWNPRRIRSNILLNLQSLNQACRRCQANLKFGLLNSRSAVNKAALINDSMHDGAFDILVLTETWIISDAPGCIVHSLAPDSFTTVHQHRGSSNDKRGGGIAVIHRHELKSTNIGPPAHAEFEGLHLKFNNRRTSFIVSSIYRPPGPIKASFIKEFEDLIDLISSYNLPFIICGDFNAPGSGTRIDEHLEGLIDSHGLLQHITSPTHSKGHTLDLLITSSSYDSLISNIDISEVTYSDHHLITCNISTNKPPPSTRIIHRRSLRRINWVEFEQDLYCVSDDLLFCNSDADDFTIRIHKSLEELLDKHAPVRKLSIRVGQQANHQLSSEAIEAKKTCRRLERRYLRLRTNVAKQLYKSAKEAAKIAILNSRASIKEELNSDTNPRSMWRSLHKLLHSRPTQNYTEDECSTLVNSFNSFFISKITKIHESIANTLASSPISPFPTRQFSGTPISVLQPVSSEEVLKLIHSLPNKSSPLDSLPTTLLKKYALILSPILSKLANLSFSTGTFPSIFKKAQVLPLLKKPNLDPTSPANYRPISNLSTMSKLLERLLLSRLRPHITTSSNFSSFQSAYRPGFSTETALLHIFNNLSDICGKGNCAVMVGLDLSAAFDTINHQLLLERLKSDFGIDGLAFSWLQSYLSNRTQYVKLGNHSSSPVELLAGVPQGSVLGPLLFTTYTSPLSNIIHGFEVSFHQYADDTSLFSILSSDSMSDQLRNLRKCTDAINDWHLVNFLQLNPQKSEIMFIGTPIRLKTMSPPTSINVAGTLLPSSTTLKLLSVTFDSHLSFKEHSASIIKSCNHLIWSIRHICPLLSVDSTSALARSLVLSCLDYCNSLLYGTSTSLILSLQRVQNKLAKLVLLNPTFNSTDCLKKLHWLPIHNRIIFKIALMTYRTLATSNPPYLQHLLFRRHTSGLRSSSTIQLHQPVHKSSLINRGFSHASPAVWNALPPQVRDQPSLELFKSHLKTHLFRTPT